MNGLEIRGVGKRFGEVKALDSVSLAVEEGELFFLLGPSGCGKTTLLRIVAGFSEADGGSVRFAGRDLAGVPVEKRNFGMVFQNYSLWPHMTVFDNVAYGLKMRGAGPDETARRVGAVLEMVDMAGLARRRPAALSGGQQQRVALARALVYEPRLLLLDEPLSNLDAKLRKEMRREITRIHRELGITMVYVTHDQEEAAAMADRMALMNSGRVAQVGTPREVYRRPSTLYAATFFGQANVMSGRVTRIKERRVTVAWRNHEISAEVAAADTVPEPGTAVHAVVRPEEIRILGSSPGTGNRLEAKLVVREFAGSVETLTVQVEDERFTVVCVSGPLGGRADEGADVTIGFEPAAVHLIVDGAGS